ncbi:MAG: endopeptidase La [Candidatus Eiseniibacteriota bacterium]|jgi:ATP-dependent Lon protease
MATVRRGDELFEIEERLPLLPLRDIVIYPYMTIPLLVGRSQSVGAIEEAASGDRTIFCVSQRQADVSDPEKQDLYTVGTVGRVLQIFRLPDGTLRVLVEGICRARLKRLYRSEELLRGRIEPLDEASEPDNEVEAFMRSTLASFNEYVRLSRKIPEEVLATANQISDAVCLSYSIASHLLLKVATRQEILEIDDARARLELIGKVLATEREILELERKIEGQVRSQVHKNQKEFYLNEQLKAIRKELGFQNEFSAEIDELAREVKKARMPKEVRERAEKELERLGRMSFMSPEATVVRNYIDWMLALPWSKRTKDNLDIDAVERILDEDHYGLRKVKDRIIEQLAVLKLSGNQKGPILCLVGPPGVGKTSLGHSIARAIGRKFVRMSLGGVRDEAEIRGHRRTYVGSMPGRILQAMKRAGRRNPVILLDEVDKIGQDFRGDPAAALLEVLDPEQNHAFNDHYLEVDFDLSEVMFITTANVMHTIPPALQDRMEVLRLPGYLEHEKLEIARRFLLPKQLEASGLQSHDLGLSRDVLLKMIREYTREAGVRNLEREIATLCRKVARRKAAARERPVAGGAARGRRAPVAADGTADGQEQATRGRGRRARRPVMQVTPRKLASLLGVPRFVQPTIERQRRVGVATGLAWTEHGGEVLTVEASVVPGKGDLQLTGKLGDVMRESGVAALSYARSRAELLGLEREFFGKVDLHVHVPEGAIPKDGPSAGITMAVAVISALTGVPTSADLAMTGEITLRGAVLPIGGLSEKIVAARQHDVARLMMPAGNTKDLPEVPKEALKGVEIITVDTMDDVLRHAFAGSVLKRGSDRDPRSDDQPDEPSTGVYAH